MLALLLSASLVLQDTATARLVVPVTTADDIRERPAPAT